MPQTIVVLGARNLGGAIVDHFLELGWSAAAVARSQDTLEPGQPARRAGTAGRRIRSGRARRRLEPRGAARLARRGRQRGRGRAPDQRDLGRSEAASSPRPIWRTSEAGRWRSPSRRSRSCRRALPRSSSPAAGR